MPTLDQHPSFQRVKMALIGDSSSGKTGALASLVNDEALTELFVERTGEAQELFIIDLDDGLDPLRQYVQPEHYERVHFKTIKEPMRITKGGQLRPRDPAIQMRVLEVLDQWKDGDENYGPISDWGPNRILVIDPFTAYGVGILRWVRVLNNRYAVLQREGKDFGPAQELEHEFFDLLFDVRIKCSVVVTSHINYQEAYGEAPEIVVGKGKDGEIVTEKEERGYMMALGKKNPPIIGRHFNTIVMAKATLTGREVKRVIRTQSTAIVQLKNPFEKELPVELPLATGLAEIFKVFLTHGWSEKKPEGKKSTKSRKGKKEKEPKAPSKAQELDPEPDLLAGLGKSSPRAKPPSKE